MKILLSHILLAIILPIIDIYVFIKLRKNLNLSFRRRYFTAIYWLSSLLLIGFMIFFSFAKSHRTIEIIWPIFSIVSLLLIMIYIPKTLAFTSYIISDIGSLFIKSVKIKRLLNKSLLIGFIIIIGIFELSILYGVFYGRFNFQTPEYKINDSQIPASFENYRIVHLSDLHLGSFVYHKNRVSQIVEIVNSLEPDLIVFTGDLVNNTTREAWIFRDELAKLNAKDGIIAVTGNHDYGTYVTWDNNSQFEDNFNDLIRFYESIGAKLLLNDTHVIERNGQQIYIAGIESSGMPPFDELGDLNEAVKTIPDDAFVVLLSHDPSYWQSRVINYPQINLTLSGHTHSMQLGIWCKSLDIKWSPVKFLYPEWHGLYSHNKQKLLINSGAGFIALPVRTGAPPEIGLIVLRGE
jgi:uncharacterized protein